MSFKHVKKMVLTPYSEFDNINKDSEIDRAKTVVEKTFSELDQSIVSILKRKDLNDELKLKLYLNALKKYLDFRTLLFGKLSKSSDLMNEQPLLDLNISENISENNKKRKMESDSENDFFDTVNNYSQTSKGYSEDDGDNENFGNVFDNTSEDLDADDGKIKEDEPNVEKLATSDRQLSNSAPISFDENAAISNLSIIKISNPRFKSKINRILKKIKNNNKLKWLEDGTVYLDGQIIKGSNIVKILENVLREKKQDNVIGFNAVYNFLSNQQLIANKYIAKWQNY